MSHKETNAFFQEFIVNTNPTIFDSYPAPSTLAFPEAGAPRSPLAAAFAGIKEAFSNWAQASALSHAESRLWDVAQSDPRIMAELMLARMHDEPSAGSATASPIEAAVATTNTVNESLSQGWGTLIEHAYQSRFRKADLLAA